MKAVVWHGTNDVRVERVPDPAIVNPRDAIIRITTTAICGSDLHLLDGFIPTMKAGDILGHEFMGEVVDQVKTAAMMATDRPNALREAIHACRKGGVVSIPGVYGGFLDKVPFGAAFAKGLTFKMGQTHVIKYMQPLLDLVQEGAVDPSFVITHRLPIDRAPDAYKMFRDNKNECIKVVLKPHGETVH